MNIVNYVAFAYAKVSMDTFNGIAGRQKYPWILLTLETCFLNITFSTYLRWLLLGADDDGIRRLTSHFESTIGAIIDGSWRHLPTTSTLKEGLRSLKLVDWKIRQKDINDDPRFSTFDYDVRGMWPDIPALKSIVADLRGKVSIY